MHKQFSTVLPPFLMVFFGKWTLNQFQGHEEISVLSWQNLKIITLLKLHLLKCKIEFVPLATDNISTIMYNSDHKSKVIIRLRLNMNFLANGGCFKDFPLITCTLLATSYFKLYLPKCQIEFTIFGKWYNWKSDYNSDQRGILSACQAQIE